MPYSHLIKELGQLRPSRLTQEVRHIGRRPATAGSLRRAGLTHIAAHPSLYSRSSAPVPFRLADRIVAEPFFWGDKCYPGRYSKGFAILYAAVDLSTAIAEVEYHLDRNGGVAGGLRARYLIVTATVSGVAKDLCSFPTSAQTELVHDRDYRPTQALGAAARREPLDFIIAPSARRSGARNCPIFSKDAIKPIEARSTIEFFLNARGKIAWKIGARRR